MDNFMLQMVNTKNDLHIFLTFKNISNKAALIINGSPVPKLEEGLPKKDDERVRS